jgi:hypothetical protein
VTVEMTRRVVTNIDKPVGPRAPMDQLVSAREYPTATFKDVTAPNADTLYSSAFLDLSKEPDILSRGFMRNWLPKEFTSGANG